MLPDDIARRLAEQDHRAERQRVRIADASLTDEAVNIDCAGSTAA
jgi:hypothetical protein